MTERRTPLIIAHRGASGERPEHTLGAYRLAIEQGAEVIEPDLVVTADGHLIARHENDLGPTTDVAAHPEFAARRTTKVINGVTRDGWFSEDFTLAEIRTLGARERYPAIRPASAAHDGEDGVPELGEIVALVRERAAAGAPEVAIYPELKYPTWFESEGTAQDGAPLRHQIERLLVARLAALGVTAPAQAMIQCFEIECLLDLKRHVMPAHGVDFPLVQLIGPLGTPGAPYDLRFAATRSFSTGEIYGELADLIELDGGVTWDALLHPDVLDWMARSYARGVALAAADLLRPAGSAAVTAAHRAGLWVHAYTLRAEKPFLGLGTDGNPLTLEDTFRQLLALGVDGIFTDHPGRVVQLRAELTQ